MLGIILFILKVLGIIVLCALGLVFLILLLVLFAPIRYSSEGSKYADNLNVKALVTYLNPIIRVKISYPDKTIVKVRILGITVFPAKSKEKTSDGQKEEKAKETREQRLAGEASEAIDGKEKRVSESSSKDRKVSETGEDTEFGHKVVIDHGNGYTSIYRYQSNPLVAIGDSVSQGGTLYVIDEEDTELGYQITKDSAFVAPADMMEIKG